MKALSRIQKAMLGIVALASMSATLTACYDSWYWDDKIEFSGIVLSEDGVNPLKDINLDVVDIIFTMENDVTVKRSFDIFTAPAIGLNLNTGENGTIGFISNDMNLSSEHTRQVCENICLYKDPETQVCTDWSAYPYCHDELYTINYGLGDIGRSTSQIAFRTHRGTLITQPGFPQSVPDARGIVTTRDETAKRGVHVWRNFDQYIVGISAATPTAQSALMTAEDDTTVKAILAEKNIKAYVGEINYYASIEEVESNTEISAEKKAEMKANYNKAIISLDNLNKKMELKKPVGLSVPAAK
jgi:hypothetical protein